MKTSPATANNKPITPLPQSQSSSWFRFWRSSDETKPVNAATAVPVVAVPPTAKPSATQIVPLRSSQSSTSKVNTAVENVDNDRDPLAEFHKKLKEWLYRTENTSTNAFWLMVEENVHVRREIIVYALITGIALSILAHNFAGVMCSIIVAVYPAVCTHQVIFDKPDAATLELRIHWLRYWSIFAFVTFIESFGEWTSTFPFRLLKAAFFFSVSIPQLGLTTAIYTNTIEPTIKTIHTLRRKYASQL
jgi:hypothetical protein